MGRKPIHGHTRCDGWMSPTYRVWVAMRTRCNNPNHTLYERYGGRGIKVCDRWNNSFVNFLSDMGERPEEMSIERIDNDKGYCPSNCKWATAREQQNNTSNNVVVSYKNQTHTLAEWSRILGIKHQTIRTRYRRGLPIEKVLYPGRLDRWKGKVTEEERS